MNRQTKESERAKEITYWASAYARNRSLGIAVALVLYAFVTAGIGLAVYFAGVAYRNGHLLLFWICVAALAVATLLLAYLSIPVWGGTFIERVTRLFYREGQATLATPDSRLRRRTVAIVVPLFALCVLTSVVLGFLEAFPQEYMQPVSALYIVPFLVTLVFLIRPAISLVTLLWPILYTLHAVLILVGLPVRFQGELDFLNILIPIAGYGILTAVICHLYNRFALRQLRRLASTTNGGV